MNWPVLLFLAGIVWIGVATANPQSCPVWLSEYNITGDGSDEGYKLETAFSYSKAYPPCPIIFPENKTIFFSNYLSLGDDTEVVGNGSTLKMIDGWSNRTDGYSVIRTGQRNHIHNLKFDGNRNNVSHTGVISNILLNNDVLFENNEISNTYAYGTYLYRNNNATVRNNFFHDGYQYGFATGGTLTAFSENIHVYNNTFWNFSEVAIKIRACGSSKFSNNTIIIPDILGVSAVGIRLYSADYPNRDITINSNTISGDFKNGTGRGASTGIFSDSNDNPGSVISNNNINSTFDGIVIKTDGAIISNNIIKNTRYSGIRTESNNSIYHGNVLTNTGIIINNGPGRFPTNNTYRYNIIKGGNRYWRAYGDGVFLWYGGNANTFYFNYISSERYGINIDNSFGTVYNTSIYNNKIIGLAKCYNLGGTAFLYNNTCCSVPDPASGILEKMSVAKTAADRATLLFEATAIRLKEWNRTIFNKSEAKSRRKEDWVAVT